MSIKKTGNWNLDPKKILEEAMTKDIIEKVPETAPYKSLLKYTLNGGRLDTDISALPEDVIRKINAAFPELKKPE